MSTSPLDYFFLTDFVMEQSTKVFKISKIIQETFLPN